MPAAAVAVAAAITADMTPVRAEKKIAKNVKEGQFETPPPVTEKKKSKFFGLAKSTKKTFPKKRFEEGSQQHESCGVVQMQSTC